jgi:hypothetical protein
VVSLVSMISHRPVRMKEVAAVEINCLPLSSWLCIIATLVISPPSAYLQSRRIVQAAGRSRFLRSKRRKAVLDHI